MGLHVNKARVGALLRTSVLKIMQFHLKMQFLILVLLVSQHQCNRDGDDPSLRTKRQIPKDIKQGRETTGYEKRLRELCEEVVDRICKPIKEVEYRKEIQTRCDTRIQQKCNTTIRERPREVCTERTKTQCFQDFKVVEDTTYDHECENIVQHICEEHYKVPVPVPVPIPHPIPHPHPHPVHFPHPGPHSQRLTNVVRSLPRVPRHGIHRRKRDSQVIDHQQLLFELKNALKAPTQPIVHHQEIPAPPGCRSLVTQKCHKIPVKINRKLPKESCEEIPDIQCHLELEEYEEPVCENVPVEECEDIYKQIPFLVDDEECKDVPRLECTEVEEEVPIQVCTNIDINRDVIISSYGKTYSVDGTETKTSRAEIVGRIPNITSADEEDRSGRFLRDRGRRPVNLDDIRARVFGSSSRTKKSETSDSSRRKKVVNFLKRLMAE